jgi:hypothetical protein
MDEYRKQRYIRREYRDLNTESLGELKENTAEWSYLSEYADAVPLTEYTGTLRKDAGIKAAKQRAALKDHIYVCSLDVVKPILRHTNLELFLSSIPDVCTSRTGAYWVLGLSDFDPNTDADYTRLRLYLTSIVPMSVLDGFAVCTPPVKLKHHTAQLTAIPTPEWITNK